MQYATLQCREHHYACGCREARMARLEVVAKVADAFLEAFDKALGTKVPKALLEGADMLEAALEELEHS